MSAAGRVLAAAAILAGIISTPAAAQNPASRGAVLYTWEGYGCIGCHPQTRDPYAFGPSLCQILGRRAGTHEAYDAYSEALKKSDIVWDRRYLDEFLEFPLRYVPGTTMGFAGIADRRERFDMIAYLVRENFRALCAWDRLTLP